MQDSSKPTQLAIASTFTSEPVRETLEFWAARFRWSLSVGFAPFNQVFQELLDPGSRLATNTSGINVLLVRWDDLLPGGANTSPQQCEALLPRVATDLESALRAASDRAAPHIVVMARSDVWTAEKRHAFELDLASRLSTLDGVSAFTSAWIDRHYLVNEWQDRSADQVGRVPFTAEYFAALGTIIARAVQALRGRPYKVIVLDCDNTLWGGVCGEDGALGVRLDAPYRALQELMVMQADRGRLLCLCSKNSEADVRAVFTQRSDMVLPWSRITAHRVNWDSKATNLASLASELNLGLDSFIFVDDNPIECASVRAAHPDVLTVQLPERADDIPAMLDHVWAFDVPSVTADDRRRGQMYQENSRRERAKRGASSLGEFLAGLEMRITIGDVTAAGVARAAQMTQRTNQFNTTTRRRTEHDLRTLLGTPAACVQVDLSDRFGDSGTVGLAIGHHADGELDVDSLLLSCRALGRGVEHRLVAHLGQRAQQAGLARVRFRFHRTERNEPLQRFFDALGALPGASWDRSTALVLPTPVAAAVAFDPTTPSAGEVPTEEDRAAPVAANGAVDVLRGIPEEWRTAAAVWSAIRGTTRPRPDLQSTFVEPSSPLEQQLAQIWRDVLRVDRVGLDDRFADLGGTSLTVVRVHGRLLSELGVSVDITELFQHATVRALAAHLSGMGVDRGARLAQSRAERQRAAFAALSARPPRSPVRARNES